MKKIFTLVTLLLLTSSFASKIVFKEYIMKSGDTINKKLIERGFDIKDSELMGKLLIYNGLDPQTAKKIPIGEEILLPIFEKEGKRWKKAKEN